MSAERRYVKLSHRLRAIREGLGIASPVAAEFAGAGITIERIEELETRAGADPTRDEMEALGRLYGVPPEDLVSPAFRMADVKVLFDLQTQDINAECRVAVARLALVAREYCALEELVGLPARYPKVMGWSPDGDYGDDGAEHREGIRLARKVRARIRLAHRPIDSMATLADSIGMLVLYANLPDDMAGFALMDSHHGPTVAVNVNGRNDNVWRLRFTIAHELCHVLFDRGNKHRLARYDDYAWLDGAREGIERRASAFAIHLLAPDKGVREMCSDVRGPADKLRLVMRRYGIHYTAARKHLPHVGAAAADELGGVYVDPTPTVDWRKREAPAWTTPFPWDDVPLERRGRFAILAVSAWHQGHITRSRLHELLQSAEGEPDHLVDYFAGDLIELRPPAR